MRILLSGQKYFGQEVLRLLLKMEGMGIEVVAVCAPPERRDGKPDRLWILASEAGLPLIRGGTLNAVTLPSGIDLIVCAHSHDFISSKTRSKTRLGGIGYHPSLLPLHRGRDAVSWTIRMSDRVAGGTVYWLSDKVDGGPVAAQDWCFVRPDDTPLELWIRELQPMGLRLFYKTLTDILGGRIIAIPQDESLATWEPSIGRPPLFRPDLPMIGPPPEGFEVITSRKVLQESPATS